MCLLGWRGLADGVSRIAGDDSRVGDAGALFACCDAGACDFDDGSPYGLARFAVEDDGVAGADVQATVEFLSVGVAGGRVVLALTLGRPLLVAEGPAYRNAVAVDVGLLP